MKKLIFLILVVWAQLPSLVSAEETFLKEPVSLDEQTEKMRAQEVVDDMLADPMFYKSITLKLERANSFNREEFYFSLKSLDIIVTTCLKRLKIKNLTSPMKSNYYLLMGFVKGEIQSESRRDSEWEGKLAFKAFKASFNLDSNNRGALWLYARSLLGLSEEGPIRLSLAESRIFGFNIDLGTEVDKVLQRAVELKEMPDQHAELGPPSEWGNLLGDESPSAWQSELREVLGALVPLSSEPKIKL